MSDKSLFDFSDKSPDLNKMFDKSMIAATGLMLSIKACVLLDNDKFEEMVHGLDVSGRETTDPSEPTHVILDKLIEDILNLTRIARKELYQLVDHD